MGICPFAICKLTSASPAVLCFLQRTSMPVRLLNILLKPVPAFAWLGRQGTRAIATLVFVGIVVPPIGNLLKSFVTESIFLLLCISFAGLILRYCTNTCGSPARALRKRKAHFAPPVVTKKSVTENRKLIHSTSYSSPLYGQATILFESPGRCS